MSRKKATQKVVESRSHFESDEEHIDATLARTEFVTAMARAAAKELSRFKPEIREYLVVFFQDEMSLFSPYVSDIMYEELKRIDDGRREFGG